MQLANRPPHPAVVAPTLPTLKETLLAMCAILGFTHFVIHVLPWSIALSGGISAAQVVRTFFAIEIYPHWPILLLCALLVMLIYQVRALRPRCMTPAPHGPPGGPRRPPAPRQIVRPLERAAA